MDVEPAPYTEMKHEPVYLIDIWEIFILALCFLLLSYFLIMLWKFRKDKLTKHTSPNFFKIVLFTVLSALSLIICSWFSGILLVSCSGHPPTNTVIGVWILPLSYSGSIIFFALTIYFWSSRNNLKRNQGTKPVIQILKLILNILVASFAFLFCWMATSMLTLLIININECFELATYILFAIQIVSSFLFAFLVYRKLSGKSSAKHPTSPPPSACN
jgi:heme/copper-type cytochrome/quinol oxidase subunit 2